ncbi:MAG: VOC family protein [Halohasta sp.]
MQFTRVTIPAVDPPRIGEWYRSRFAPAPDSAGTGPSVRLGETGLRFTEADAAPPAHLAFRVLLEGAEIADWLADRATISPVDGEPSRRFEFLDATAVYFEDCEGNVLEGLCYDGDRRPTAVSASVVDGVTEVGLPARDPPALVEWLETTVGLSPWRTPSETFAWVGDRHARFVVIPTGREWYPTDRAAGSAPISVTVVDKSAHSGRHVHPTLPYEIVVD